MKEKIHRDYKGKFANTNNQTYHYKAADICPMLNHTHPPQTPESCIASLWASDQAHVIYEQWTKPEVSRRFKRKQSAQIHDGTIDPKKHARIKKQRRDSHQRNKETDNERLRKKYRANPEKFAIANKLYYEKNADDIKEKSLDHYHNGGGKELASIRILANPRSGGGSTPLLEEIAMNLAREKYNNKCGWGGCDKIADQVNHIFGRKPHPEWGPRYEFVAIMPEFLIPYCFDHHILWHNIKGEIKEARLIEGSRDRKLDKRKKIQNKTKSFRITSNRFKN